MATGEQSERMKQLAMGDGVPFLEAAKRLGMQWTPWMGDWFVSYSPRNGNEHAEGSWEHWINLACEILNHPFTQLVRPDLYEKVPPADGSIYSDTKRSLTEDELLAELDR